MTRVILCGLLAALALGGCSKAGTESPSAKETAAALTGTASPQCALFTPAEAGKYIGKLVKNGEAAAMDTGCQWDAKDGEGFVQVQVVRARDHVPTTGAEGYRELPDVGQQGYVAAGYNGWTAGAIQGEAALAIMVSGDKTSETLAVELLKEALKRNGGSR